MLKGKLFVGNPEGIPLRQFNIPSRKVAVVAQRVISEYLDAKSLSNAKNCDFFSRFCDEKQWQTLVMADITTQPALGKNEDYKAFYRRANRLLVSIKKAIAAPNTKQSMFNDLFHAVVENGYELFAPLLIGKVNLGERFESKDGSADSTFLHTAAIKGSITMMLLLLKLGAKVDAAEAGYLSGRFTDMLLPGKGATPLIRAASNGNKECVQLLLQHGADVNYQSQGNNPRTALQAADNNGHKECADLIREHMRNLGLSNPTNAQCIIS